MQYPHDPVRPASRHSELLGFTEVSAYFDAGSGTSLYPVYVRGEANLAAKQGLAAAAEFQKILDHPGVVQNELIGALAHLGLGRACVHSRDLSKAHAAYHDFFSLWKDADPDVPFLKQALAGYANCSSAMQKSSLEPRWTRPIRAQLVRRTRRC